MNMRTIAVRIHLCMIGTISAVQTLPDSLLLQCFGIPQFLQARFGDPDCFEVTVGEVLKPAISS